MWREWTALYSGETHTTVASQNDKDWPKFFETYVNLLAAGTVRFVHLYGEKVQKP